MKRFIFLLISVLILFSSCNFSPKDKSYLWDKESIRFTEGKQFTYGHTFKRNKGTDGIIGYFVDRYDDFEHGYTSEESWSFTNSKTNDNNFLYISWYTGCTKITRYEGNFELFIDDDGYNCVKTTRTTGGVSIYRWCITSDGDLNISEK